MQESQGDPPPTEGCLTSPPSSWSWLTRWLKGSTGAPNERNVCGCSPSSLQGLAPKVTVEAALSKAYQWQAHFLSFFALQNWRVKTLTHALSAMQHPPSLIVVHCGPPKHSGTEDRRGQPIEELGGYSPEYNTVWLCGNRLWSPFSFRRILIHELVHAFDFARAKIDTNNCRHVACTEIRAINLSEQCGLWASRSLPPEGLESSLDRQLILSFSEKESRRLQQEAAAAKVLSDEAAAAALDAAKAGAAASAATSKTEGDSAPSSAAAAALARAEQLAARAAAAAKAAQEAKEAAAAASRGVPLWQSSKRNACVANQAKLSVQQLKQCEQPGVAVSER